MTMLDDMGLRPGDDPTRLQAPLTLATHPRAARRIRQAKGWGGLVGFALVAWLCWGAGMSAFDAGVRALGGGIVGFLAAWAASLTFWRILVEAEHKVAAERELAAKDAEAAEAAPPFEV